MIRLRYLVTTVSDMIDRAPNILNLYSADELADDPVPVLDLFANSLNVIMDIVQKHYPRLEPRNVDETDYVQLLNDWVDAFCFRLESQDIDKSTKRQGVQAFEKFVGGLKYNLRASHKDNLQAVWWILKNWKKLHAVCPGISKNMYEFVGHGICYKCNGCSGLMNNGDIRYNYHLYYKNECNKSFVMSLHDGSVFQAQGSNLCQGDSLRCRSGCTIMRCSDGQAIDHCCNVPICDACWLSHLEKYHDSD